MQIAQGARKFAVLCGLLVAQLLQLVGQVERGQHRDAIGRGHAVGAAHRAHASIGVLGAVSVATACLVPGSPAAAVASVAAGMRKTLSVEHPSGETTCVLEIDEAGVVVTAAMLRTARKLMDGKVFA